MSIDVRIENTGFQAAFAAAGRMTSKLRRSLAPDLSRQDAAARKVFSECFPLDQILTYGSCVPLVSNVVGAFRILYGVLITSYGVCEIINNIARQNFLQKPVTFMDSIRGGGLPCIAGLEHIAAGYAAQSGLIGNICCFVYTLLLRNIGDSDSKKEIEIDPNAMTIFWDRIKKHPLYQQRTQDMQNIWEAIMGLPTQGSGVSA